MVSKSVSWIQMLKLNTASPLKGRGLLAAMYTYTNATTSKDQNVILIVDLTGKTLVAFPLGEDFIFREGAI